MEVLETPFLLLRYASRQTYLRHSQYQRPLLLLHIRQLAYLETDVPILFSRSSETILPRYQYLMDYELFCVIHVEITSIDRLNWP